MKDVTRRMAAKWAMAGPAVLAAGPAPARQEGGGIGIAVDRPTVEWRTDPVGIDTRRPRFRWTLVAHDPRARGVVQSGFRLRLFGGAGSGADDTMLFDSGFVTDGGMAYRPPADLPLQSQSAYVWRLTLRDGHGVETPETVAGRFTTGIFGPWAAGWIAAGPDTPRRGRAIEGRGTPRATPEVMPVFRRGFDMPKSVAFAVLSIAGLGHYSVVLNGAPVMPGVLASGWSDYPRTVLYDSYDVTALVRGGRNILSVMLGNGFYNVEGAAGRYAKLIGSFGQPKLIARLRVLHRDGSESILATDPAWSTRPGPIVFSSIFGGEDHDARVLADGWDRREDGDHWRPATAVEGPGGALRANGVPPVRVLDTIASARVTAPKPDVLLFDVGVNFAGRPRITLKDMIAGQVVRLWPGELLTVADGTVDQKSMTGGPPGKNGIVFTYTARGGGTESWEPSFTYTGYRYLQIEGATSAQIVSVEGRVMHADLEKVGSFACSDNRLERIHGLIDRALISNMVSVTTDCPHREKLGWLEQIYLNAPTVQYNRNAVTLYEKMTHDMIDAQQPSGMMPSIAPEFIAFVDGNGKDTKFRDTPEWGSAIVLATWATYRTYGDAGILRDNYPAMQRYVDYLAGRAKDGLVDYGLGDWYDVGPREPGLAQLTSLRMTGTATLYADLIAMAQIATVLGRRAESGGYARRAAATKAAILARLYDPRKASFDRGSQCANAMGLVLGLAPALDRARVLANLVADIRRRDDHVSAGDIGFHYVVHALLEGGRSDVLMAMLQRTDKPSYGAQLASGATALTEAWDGWRDSSQNHFMLGHIEGWFYGGVGGIRIDCARRDAPSIAIAPQPVPGLASADVAFRSVFGMVSSRWRCAGGTMTLDIAIPAGATARVTLPTRRIADIREGGRPLASSPAIRAVTASGAAATFDVGSGRYSFTTPLPAIG